METVIRKATEEDLPNLARLWVEMMDQHSEFEPRVQLTSMAQSAYQSYLSMHARTPKSLVAVVERDGATAGFCCAYVCRNLPMFKPSEFGYISDLYVVPDCHRQGVGSVLLEHVHAWFKQLGLDCAQLQVYWKNEEGQAFWKAKGFEPFFQRMWLDLEDNDAN